MFQVGGDWRIFRLSGTAAHVTAAAATTTTSTTVGRKRAKAVRLVCERRGDKQKKESN